MRAPIVLFVYNRPMHTSLVVEALLKNSLASESDLFIFSDAPKNETVKKEVENVRLYLAKITGFKSVTILERTENWGLANNIIDGVTSVVKQYGRVIVLEDDLVVSPYFLKYMNEALDFYEKEEQVVSIHGYVYPVKRPLPETFFIKGADCWGWATWKRGWDLFCPDGKYLLEEIDKQHLKMKFDFDNSYPYYKMLKQLIEGKNNSWAIRWYASAFLQNKFTLYPGRSLVNQIGVDGSGTHCGVNEMFNVSLADSPIELSETMIQESKQGRNAFIYYFRYVMFYYKVKARLKRLFKIS